MYLVPGTVELYEYKWYRYEYNYTCTNVVLPVLDQYNYTLVYIQEYIVQRHNCRP